jgi:molybdenum cofactor guanylyltransferase
VSAPGVTAVVLAGGRSVRFGREKLAEPLDGRPLLEHAIEAVRPVATEVVVVAAPGTTPTSPADVILVHDTVAGEGPLVGLLAGLRAAREPVVLVVGGDMPTLVREVLELMLGELDRAETDVVVLEHDGRARPLPVALRRETAVRAVDGFVTAGERRLRAVMETPTLRIIPESAWRALDPQGRTLRDVDTPDDMP